MLQAAAAMLGSRLRTGVATGTRGAGGIPDAIRWFDGGHPLPNEFSVEAGEAALDRASAACGRDERVLVLLSGGASSMMCAPAEGISLADKAETTDRLMRSGTPVQQLNTVRRHLSRIKGGSLAAAAARSLTLVISDVHQPPDSPCDIGSGPTAPDPTTFADALAIVRACSDIPRGVHTHLERGAAGETSETPKPGDPRLAGAEWQVMANRHTAMEAAAREARRLGYIVEVEHAPTHGEARDAGRRFAEHGMVTRPLAGARCVIASGETTVTVRGRGRGGRNQEFVLGAAGFLAGEDGVLLASMGTDGVDGPTDAAGGVVTGQTYAEASALGLRVEDILAKNDAYRLLRALDDLIEWGPTLTNVGDLHILLTMGG
jgi:glycerate 2-kinase